MVVQEVLLVLEALCPFEVRNSTKDWVLVYLCRNTPRLFLLCFVGPLLSHVQLFVTPWTATRQVSLSFTIP